jgi:hypothetical protein
MSAFERNQRIEPFYQTIKPRFGASTKHLDFKSVSKINTVPHRGFKSHDRYTSVFKKNYVKGVREEPIFLRDKFDTINPYNSTLGQSASANQLAVFRSHVEFPQLENIAHKMRVIEEKTKAYGQA